jgi:hypothetical protein
MTRLVWTLPADSDLHGVSRDGRYAPFTDWSRKGNLFLRDLVRGNDRQLTNSTDDEQTLAQLSELRDYAAEYVRMLEGERDLHIRRPDLYPVAVA